MAESPITFILGFQETPIRSTDGFLVSGTETITKTREQADQDWNSAALASKTSTAIREEPDQDGCRNPYSAIPISLEPKDQGLPASFVLGFQEGTRNRATKGASNRPNIGTATGTRMREQPDSDEVTSVMGTQTITDTREESDQDRDRNGYSAIPIDRS